MPIDKVERPDSPLYRVDASPDARDEKRRQQEEGEEQERDKFEKGVQWDKVLGAKGVTGREVQVSSDSVKKLTFKNLSFHKGVFTLEADLHTKDGKTHKKACIQLPEKIAKQRLKGFQAGQAIAPELLSLGQYFNMTVPIESSLSPLDPRWAREMASLNRWDRIRKNRLITSLGIFSKTGDPQWGIITTYMLALSILAFALGAMIQVIR